MSGPKLHPGSLTARMLACLSLTPQQCRPLVARADPTGQRPHTSWASALSWLVACGYACTTPPESPWEEGYKCYAITVAGEAELERLFLQRHT